MYIVLGSVPSAEVISPIIVQYSTQSRRSIKIRNGGINFYVYVPIRASIIVEIDLNKCSGWKYDLQDNTSLNMMFLSVKNTTKM